MSTNTVGVLVLIPLIPAIPVLVTWFLPWEKWLWEKIPKTILGPYLLYGAFAAAYFKMPWWWVGLLIVMGVVTCTFAWRESGTNQKIS